MKQILLVGLTILAVASARVAREAPQTEESLKDKLESGLKDVEKLVSDLTNTDAEGLKQKAGEFVEKFGTWAEKLKEETKHLEDNELVKDLRNSLDHGVEELKQNSDKHVAKFKEDHPEMYNELAKHVDTLKSTSSAVFAKFEEFANSEDAKKLKESSLQFFDDLRKSLLPEEHKKE
ncbi:uncharacterized protein LOC106088453 [Stomoxys calcitrans]|uniref:Uncharacterized protein n=1 Tax=Stomoxys calcitrans TaxID=35570 RepID=A0A1I8PVX7_STOCA|nr:uncharacterized protein LOC106088453 [Stomoxys calcitrans]